MTGIDYRGESINVIEYERGREKEIFVCNESEYYGAKCKRNSGTRKMENRKNRGIIWNTGSAMIIKG